jgi:sugar phosphate isomerase/epimerase
VALYFDVHFSYLRMRHQLTVTAMNNNSRLKTSRRKFIKKSAFAVAGLSVGIPKLFGAPAIVKNIGKPNSKFNGVQLGVISYSFRSLPTNAEQVLQYCIDANVSAIELMGTTAEAFAGAPHSSTEPRPPFVPGTPRPEPTAEQKAEQVARALELANWRASASMEKFKQLAKMYKDAGVSIYAWKPNALDVKNSDEEIDYAFRVARELGASHVTVEIPADPAQSKRLGILAEKHKIGVGYHGHLQQTITAWDEALSQSPYNGLNCDLGHYVAAGFDPIALLQAKHDRIYSAHLKDRKSKSNGGANLPWGEGDTPIAKILQLMRDSKYKFPGTIELEYEIPAGSNAVIEVAKCVAFGKNALEKKSGS